MTAQNQDPQKSDREPGKQEAPVETEESGAGYGNNAGQQGVGAADVEDET
jgi:hypothetical protein